MIKMTPLEKNIIEAILSSKILDTTVVSNVVDKLVIKKRVFSKDALNASKCCGFYLYFANNKVLNGLEPLPHHLGIQGSQQELPIGADFVLFIKQGNSIDFLEATFYGDALPIQLILSEHHGFTIFDRSCGSGSQIKMVL